MFTCTSKKYSEFKFGGDIKSSGFKNEQVLEKKENK